MKTKMRVFVYIFIFFLIVAIGSTFSPAVYALDRQVTMSSSASFPVSVGSTFTVTFGFSPKALTRKFSFLIGYDNTFIQLIEPCVNLSGVGTGITVGGYDTYRKRQSVGVEKGDETEKMVDLAVRITFKALKQGSTTIQVINVSDGFDENKFRNIPCSLTVNIAQQQTTTTTTPTTITTTTTTTPTTPTTTSRITTTTTRPTTTSTTTTTTTPTSTSTPTTTPSITPSTTPTVTPTTTAPEEIPDPVAWTGKRYDGKLLSVPESMPDPDRIPSSFSAVKVELEGVEMDAFQSESLPYTLFWLKAEDDDNGRFYIYDDESGVFVPYFRSEWSSRFFTVTVLPEKSIPEGFEQTTLKVRGERVPAYRLLPGAFVPYEKYRSGYEEMDAPSTASRNDQNTDASGDIKSLESFVEKKDTEARRRKDADRYVYAAEGTDPEPSETENDRLIVPIPDPPENMVLLVCRINDSAKKTLFLYDTVFDSMISVGNWPVPVRGSYLEQSLPPAPSATEKPSEETDAMIAPVETVPSESRQLSLFGLLLPPWILIVGIVVLLLLILALVFAFKSSRARRRHSFTYKVDDLYDDKGDANDRGVLNIKGLQREYSARRPKPVRKDFGFSSSYENKKGYKEDVLPAYPEKDEWIAGPNLIANLDDYSGDEDDAAIAESNFEEYFDGFPDDIEDSVLMESSVGDNYYDYPEESDDEHGQDHYNEIRDDAYLMTNPEDYFTEHIVDDIDGDSFAVQNTFDDELSRDDIAPDAADSLIDDCHEPDVASTSRAFDGMNTLPQDASSSEEVLHMRERPSPDAIRRFPNMRQVFLQSPRIHQSEPENDNYEPYSNRLEEDRTYFEEAYTDDDEI